MIIENYFLMRSMGHHSPETISNLLKKCDNRNYNLRSKGKLLRLSKFNTNAMKRSFSYKGAKVWNTQNKLNIMIHF